MKRRPARNIASPSAMAEASLTISSKNYSSWSLRGWLLCKMAGLEFDERVAPIDDPATRAELCCCRPRSWCPAWSTAAVKVWDTLAIAEYLTEIKPEAGLLPADPARARALPRDLRRDAFGLRQPALGAADEPQGAPSRLQGVGRRAGRHRARDGDLARVPASATAGLTCSARPPTMADAMYAPVCTRFRTYDVKLDPPRRAIAT